MRSIIRWELTSPFVSCQTDVLQFVAEVAKRDEAVNEFKYRHVPALESLDLQLQVLLLSQPSHSHLITRFRCDDASQADNDGAPDETARCGGEAQADL